ncbi:hypothetical protein J2S46_000045 [Kitasatospora herbaricolor]|uniref:hypothetical protein n=1 Tax=Kitasatospora herbaricolor TaxID=68217 RepID=UPI00174CA736|nr:hypothetical protein [Kitasatospora herbaricolor]MDQ0305489.1 hypothetical protein [Kitasatospora herbaricolor]
MSTETDAKAGTGPAAPPAGAAVPKQPTAPPDTDATTSTDENKKDDDKTKAGKEKKPHPVARWAGAQARRTGDGAKGIGELLAHWGSTADQSGEELRRRIVAGQLEAFTERRDELRQALVRETKKVVRIEEEASDGGLTDAQRGQLTLTRESARRLEKALRDMNKVPFRAIQPTERQIARARTFGRLRRGAVLVTGSIATVMAAVHAPQIALLALAAGTAMAWRTGAHPPRLTHRPIPDDLLLPELDPPDKLLTGEKPGEAPADVEQGVELFPGDTGKPFPIRDVTDPAVAVECVRRALLAERVPLAYVGAPVLHPWGWETVVRVSDGTCGDIGERLGGLETKFDVGDGDVILQPNRKRTAEATLRVVTGDLFGAMKPPPYRAPHSVDVTTAGTFGMSADGRDLTFSLAELMGEVIARSGGGKSTIIRALLDWTTAAHNAVTVFLDPSGDGPGKFTDAVKLTSTSPIQIEFALLSLYRLAAGRARTRRKLGMGDTWTCTREHPAIFVFVDEFPKLTKRSKQIIAELQLVGRKEGVWLIFAAQGATSQLLGSNIAQQPALKIMGACRDVDTTQALGGGAIDWGYLPHRLQPKSGGSLNDCAKSYVVGAPGLSEDPMLHKWHYIPDDEGGRRAAERLAAGLVDIDQASIDAALKAPNPPGLKFADEDEYLRYVPWPELLAMCAEDDDESGPQDTGTAAIPPILAKIRAAFEAAGDPDFLFTDQVLEHLATTGAEWRQWDDREPADRRREAVKKIGRDLKKAGVENLKTDRRKDLDMDNTPSGYWLRDVETAITSLTD